MENKVLNISEDFVKNAIAKAINECDVHIKFILDALSVIEKYFPLTIKSYSKILKESNMAFLDQFVYRYTKLEDKIGGSIVSDIVYLFDFAENGKTFREKLGVLEKEGLIENVQTWEYFRDLRRRLSHEYALDVDRQMNTLNEVCSAYFYLVKDYNKMKEFFGNLKS